MTVQIPERLYNLLPAMYRRRDADNGEMLRALLAIIDAERQRIEDDVHTLYDDQFIETCQPWAIPYIADLLDVKLPSTATDTRAYVANAIGYRRRKGVLRTLEELTASITGWRAAAVEFYKHLAVAQHVNHPLPERTGYADVRDEAKMAHNGGPFERAPRTAEVRLVDTGRGKYGVSNIGLFVWRCSDYPIEGVRPRPVDPSDKGVPEVAGEEDVHRFHMHPVRIPLPDDGTDSDSEDDGLDADDGGPDSDEEGPDSEENKPKFQGVEIALVNPATSKSDQSRRTDEGDVPAPLRRRPLYRELERRRKGQAVEEPNYFGANTAPFGVRVLDDEGEKDIEVGPEHIYVCDLESWHVPELDGFDDDDSDEDGAADDGTTDDDATDDEDTEPIRVIVDPERGRMILLASDDIASRAVVDYAYGAAADIGGGPYDRQESVNSWLPEPGAPDFHKGVCAAEADGDDKVYATLQEALDEWDAFVERNASDTGETDGDEDEEADAGPVFGVISIMDSDSYFSATAGQDFQVRIPGGHRLAIVGARWPGLPNSPVAHIDGRVVGSGVRPHLGAGLRVERRDLDGFDDADPGELVIDGLLVEGKLEVADGALSALDIFHSTLVPEYGGIALEAPAEVDDPMLAAEVHVHLARSVTGPLEFGRLPADCTIEDSVVVAALQEEAPDDAPPEDEAADDAPSEDEADDQWSKLAIAGSWLHLDIARSTVLGQTRVDKLEADDTIFEETVEVDRRQDGCVRFSYAPADSNLPRTYRCQPQAIVDASREELGTLSDTQQNSLEARVRPSFVSRRWWESGFAMLAESCAAEILTGAEGGAEMGVYNHLHVPQRMANLRMALEEHLRVGMYAGIFYMT